MPVEDLNCELDHVSLEKAPPFKAISYPWRSSEPSHTIVVGGSLYYITANAHSVLRSVQPTFWPKWLWIDSICIDQSNVDKKKGQILLMKDIYRRASESLFD
jgi:Heterokaryon incompatibility protein (HET)